MQTSVGFAGDGAEAFEVVYRRFFPRLVRYCGHRIAERATAEDIAQEALVKALTTPGLDRSQPLWPWLRSVADNLIVDRHRKLTREVFGGPPDTPAPEDLVSVEEREALTEALRGLSERHRTAMFLRYVDDRRSSEIAALLGIKRPAAKQLIHRARNRLRAEYRRVSRDAFGIAMASYRSIRNGSRRISERLNAGTRMEWLTELSTPVLNLAGAAVIAIASLTPPPASVGAEVSEVAVSSARTEARRVGEASRSRPAPAVEKARSHAEDPSPLTTERDESGSGGLIEDLRDPNREVKHPEDAHITDIAASPNFARDRTVFAAGYVPCAAQPCPPVLFRSIDGGTTWTRLEARRFRGTVLLLPPAFGRGDDRIFAMGPIGLQVSTNGGESFGFAAIAGPTRAFGSSAISPGFDSADPTILIGAQTLMRFDDATRTVTPATSPAAPGPLNPAFAPRYPEDPRILVGGVAVVGSGGQPESIVHVCAGALCSQAALGTYGTAPRIRIARDFQRTGIAYAFLGNALFGTRDGAQSFTPIDGPWHHQPIRDVALGDASGVLVVATSSIGDGAGGVFLSRDQGSTWSPLRSPLLARGGRDMAIRDSMILVARRDRGMACSVDLGASWAQRCPRYE